MAITIGIKNQNYLKKYKSTKTQMIKKNIKLIMKIIDGKSYPVNSKNMNFKTN